MVMGILIWCITFTRHLKCAFLCYVVDRHVNSYIKTELTNVKSLEIKKWNSHFLYKCQVLNHKCKEDVPDISTSFIKDFSRSMLR